CRQADCRPAISIAKLEMHVPSIIREIDIGLYEFLGDWSGNVTRENKYMFDFALRQMLDVCQELIDCGASEKRSLHLQPKGEWAVWSLNLSFPIKTEVLVFRQYRSAQGLHKRQITQMTRCFQSFCFLHVQ